MEILSGTSSAENQEEGQVNPPSNSLKAAIPHVIETPSSLANDSQLHNILANMQSQLLEIETRTDGEIEMEVENNEEILDDLQEAVDSDFDKSGEKKAFQNQKSTNLLVYDDCAYKDIGELEVENESNRKNGVGGVQIGEIGEESPQHRQKVQSIPSSKKSNTRSAYNSEP